MKHLRPAGGLRFRRILSGSPGSSPAYPEGGLPDQRNGIRGRGIRHRKPPRGGLGDPGGRMTIPDPGSSGGSYIYLPDQRKGIRGADNNSAPSAERSISVSYSAGSSPDPGSSGGSYIYLPDQRNGIRGADDNFGSPPEIGGGGSENIPPDPPDPPPPITGSRIRRILPRLQKSARSAKRDPGGGCNWRVLHLFARSAKRDPGAEYDTEMPNKFRIL